MPNHREKKIANLNFWVVTISDTRTEKSDKSGRFIQEALQKEGHIISRYEILKDEVSQIKRVLEDLRKDKGVQVLILNGGTGISHRDVTHRVLIENLDQEIKGFGELFRHLSYQEIGAYAQLSMACGGYVGKKLIFSLPGSKKAVQLGMEKLILPVIGHAVYEITKG